MNAVDPTSPEDSTPPKELKILNSDQIFAGSREVMIRHNNEYYRLSITRTGKLILNK